LEKTALRRIPGLAACAAALIFFAGLHGAQAADADQIKAQTGNWLAAPQDGTKGCVLTFAATPVAGGYAVTGGAGCSAPIPILSSAAAWNIGDDGSLSVLDAARKVLVSFGQDEGSPWETDEGEPLWLLPALGTFDHVPAPDSVAGTWSIQRPDGEKLCQIKLSTDKDEDGTTKMSPIGDCSPIVADLKLSLWALEGFGLVLMGNDGTSLSFDMKADGSFNKSAEDGGKPLMLVRQP
jgi:hypothetical protein